jgi:hypothetical protein
MKELYPKTLTGEDLVSLAQELGKILQAGKASVTVLPIIQFQDRTLVSDSANPLAQALGKLLSQMPGACQRPGNPGPREGVFRYDGRGSWAIGLHGDVLPYGNTIGFHQLQYLLRHPQQRVSVVDLAQVCGQKIVVNQLCTEHLADTAALDQYRQELENLRDQIEMAEQTGNVDRATTLANEKEKLMHHIANAQPFRGINRPLADQCDKLRKRVSFTLRSSLRKIIDPDPELGEHLHAGVKPGFACAYFPVTKINWTF